MIHARVLLVPLCAFAVALAQACSDSERAPAGAAAQPATRTLELAVEGMTCGGCEQTIAIAVRALAGVTDCRADFAKSRAWIDYDPARASEGTIAAAIRGAGFATPGRQ